MFSDPYRKAYREMAFASGEDASVEMPARRDALAVLRNAADCCWEQDMRTEEVRAALDFLKRCEHDGMCERFWRALHYPDPLERRRLARMELRVIARSLPDLDQVSRRTNY